MPRPKSRKKDGIGSIGHLKEIRRKIQFSVRPMISLEEKLIISALIGQEIIRRNLLASSRGQMKALGIDLDSINKFPKWLK